MIISVNYDTFKDHVAKNAILALKTFRKATIIERDLVKHFAIFWYVLVCGTYIVWQKFKWWKVPALVGDIMVVDALRHCTLLHCVWFESYTDEHVM